MQGQFPVQSKLPYAAIATASRHVFLCIGPDCCKSEEGEDAWRFLKSATASLGIPVLRSKAACLRICAGGPWLVVYPDGIWYGEMTPDRIHRVLVEHVLKGVPVAEWACLQTGCQRSATKEN